MRKVMRTLWSKCNKPIPPVDIDDVEKCNEQPVVMLLYSSSHTVMICKAWQNMSMVTPVVIYGSYAHSVHMEGRGSGHVGVSIEV